MFFRNYNRYYDRIILRGVESSPRGLATIALYDEVATFESLRFPRRPKDNPAIGIVEGLQSIAGIFDHEAIAAAAPNAKLNLFTHQSAYGPRIGTQLDAVIEELQSDPLSRRAQIIIADPSNDRSELPCTTAIQFQIRLGTLNTSVYMRSSDAVWGLPYDLIQFSFVSNVVASCLGIHNGDITMHLGNAHVYSETAVHDEWTDDQLILPKFTKVETWRTWATLVNSHHYSRKALLGKFVLSELEDIEYAFPKRGV